MWNKRRDEEPAKTYVPQSHQPAAPSPMEQRKEATPVSTPAGRFEPEAPRAQATIGKAVRIVGQIFSKEDLYVDGDLEGSVEALEHRLTVGPHGTVKAEIKAREVVALGNIQGNVQAAEKMEIRKEAKLVGDIRTARITIEDGAYFKGSIDIVKSESRSQQPQPAKPQTQPQAQPPVGAQNR